MLSFDLIFCQDELCHELCLISWYRSLVIFCIEITVDMVILLRRVVIIKIEAKSLCYENHQSILSR
jgi:hypothetical protein